MRQDSPPRRLTPDEQFARFHSIPRSKPVSMSPCQGGDRWFESRAPVRVLTRSGGASGIVRQRLADNRQLLVDPHPQIRYVTTPPTRTDDGKEAVPFLQVIARYAEPNGPRISRAEMLAFLLAQHGPTCQGCDRTFDDPRYLELDHNTPCSDSGLNHITNRILLCGPCNRLKSNQYTLSGLRRQNQRLGYMAGPAGA